MSDYIRKIQNDIANYKATIEGLEEEARRYEANGDMSSVRSMNEEIRRTQQMISNLEAQL
jgi:hypothetical protein